MKLLADIGNSQIKIAETTNQKLLNIRSFPIEDFERFSKYVNTTYNNKNPSLFFSSVLGDKFNKEFRKIFEDLYIKATQFKSSKSLLTVKNCYNQPQKLGSDRWAQIVAAHKILKSNTMIVSCGSVISIDYVTRKGCHKGGLLLSGAEKYSNCFLDIHNLKSVKLTNNKKTSSCILQPNTAKQISMGYRIMISSSITETYSSLCQTGKPKPKLLITGSYSKNISGDLKIKCLVEPYFVLKSLAIIQDQ